MLTESDQIEPELHWPPGYDRTHPEDRGPYPGDLAPTRKESFESITSELEQWDATEGSVTVTTASQHYADRPNIPHQHDRPDEVGVATYYLREDRPADEWHAVACDLWETQRENARAIALWARRQRLAERCGVTTAQSTHAASRLPPGDESGQSQSGGTIVAEPGLPRDVSPHDVLGTIPEDDKETIERRGRALKKKHHPDSGGDREQFQRVVAAERMLLDG